MAIAKDAGFAVSEKVPKPFNEESFAFSPIWSKRHEDKVPLGRFWYTSMAGESVTKEVTGTDVEVVLVHGVDGGIANVTIDGKPAAVPEIDTFAKEFDWSKRTLVAKDLPHGKHKVTVTVTGRQSDSSRHCYVELVDIIGK